MSQSELLDPDLLGQPAWSLELPRRGPLDLLLHLCQKHELDVLEIPIAFVTSKYLEYLAVMQLMQLDLAAEYLVMAATLAHIKSKMLLPAPPPGQEDEAGPEEEGDPREALIRRLLEYQRAQACRRAARRPRRGRARRVPAVGLRRKPLRRVGREAKKASGLPPLAEIPLYALVAAFQRVLDNSRSKLSHDVVADRISLTDRIGERGPARPAPARGVRRDIRRLATKFDLVITFLALLEMARLRMTRLFQTEPLGPLYIEVAADDDPAAGVTEQGNKP